MLRTLALITICSTVGVRDPKKGNEICCCKKKKCEPERTNNPDFFQYAVGKNTFYCCKLRSECKKIHFTGYHIKSFQNSDLSPINNADGANGACMPQSCPENTEGTSGKWPNVVCTCTSGYTGTVDWLWDVGRWSDQCKLTNQNIARLPPPITLTTTTTTPSIESISDQSSSATISKSPCHCMHDRYDANIEWTVMGASYDNIDDCVEHCPQECKNNKDEGYTIKIENDEVPFFSCAPDMNECSCVKFLDKDKTYEEMFTGVTNLVGGYAHEDDKTTCMDLCNQQCQINNEPLKGFCTSE